MDEEELHYACSEKTIALVKEAREKKVSPCALCEDWGNPDYCANKNGCTAWKCWFKDCWRRIRKESGFIK